MENMYNRLMHIQIEFSELREISSNIKVIENYIRVMLRKPRCKDYMSALDAM
jgi:hypothetical protein